MQFEVGKKYVDTTGEIYTYIAKRRHSMFPLIFLIDGTDEIDEIITSRREDGKYSSVGTHTADIVAEYKKPKKFTLTLIRNKETNKTFLISKNSFTLFTTLFPHEEIIGTLEVSEEDFKKE